MTPMDFLRKMREIDKGFDTESTHAEADDLMCELLTELGYGEGVEVYKKMYKWYA